MVSRIRRGGALIAVAALSVMVAGCGDDESDDDAEAATVDSDAESTSDDTAAESADTAASDATEAASTDTAASSDSATDVGSADVDRTGWPDKLILGAVPSEESSSLEQSYDGLIQVFQEELGVEVEFFQATEYAGIIEAQIAGRIDLAQYGPFSYIVAVQNGAKIEPIGATVPEKGGEPGYQSFGLTRADNDEINDLADYEGKNICFVDPTSTSGYLYPSAGLLDAGVDPKTDVNGTFAGGHDASALAIANGDCEAGFAYDTMTDELIKNGDLAEGDLKVVWKSPVIPGSPMAISTDLPESFRAEVSRLVLEEANIDALVERGICESADDCTATDDNNWGWAPVDDTFYDGVREVCATTKAEACEGEG